MTAQVPSDEIAPAERALDVIYSYGGIDGAHHKQWVLDQVVRILTETDEGYLDWVAEFESDGEASDAYAWDEGIAP